MPQPQIQRALGKPQGCGNARGGGSKRVVSVVYPPHPGWPTRSAPTMSQGLCSNQGAREIPWTLLLTTVHPAYNDDTLPKKNKPELLPRATTPVATLSSLHEDQQHKAIALQLSDEQKIDRLDFKNRDVHLDYYLECTKP